MSGTSLFAVALGGAMGAVLRYALTALLPLSLFPWAILGINIAGSFCIGLVWALFADAQWFQHWGRALLVVGLLGGFTTFSAFSMETLTMLQQQRVVTAATYIVLSALGCVTAAALGHTLGSVKG